MMLSSGIEAHQRSRLTTDVLALAFGFAFLVSSASAQEGLRTATFDPSLTLIGQYGGAIEYSVAAGEGIVLVGEYDGIRVIDVSDPTTPTEVGYAPTGNITNRSLVLKGSTAYSAGTYQMLSITDFSNTAHPIQIGGYTPPGINDAGSYAVSVHESVAYIATGGAGLLIVDVTDPIHPRLLNQYEGMGTSFRGVGVFRDFIYATYWPPGGCDGLHVLDVSDPSAPRFLRRMEGLCFGVSVHGRLAYVQRLGGGLQILDLAEPAFPVERGRLEVASGTQVQVVDTLAYVADRMNGLRVFDIADPDHPVEVAWFETPARVKGVAVVGEFVFLATTDGLFVLRNDLVSTGAEEHPAPVPPDTFTLDAVYPNPFSEATTTSYTLAVPQHVRVSVFDIMGREVVQVEDGVQPAGPHEVTVDGSALTSGVYLLQVEAGGVRRSMTMVVLR